MMMKKLFSAAVYALLLNACQLPAAAAPEPSAADISADTLIIYYQTNAKNGVLEAVRQYGASVLYDYRNFNAVAVRLPAPPQPEAAVRHFENVRGVLQASRNHIQQLH
ncbi:MAG: hypothetical protein Q4E77_02515 [Conchiformibius sp.]|nr:hypothetical protein [Conchiformibius sp.]